MSGPKVPNADEQAFYDACRWAFSGGDLDALGPALAEQVRCFTFCNRLGITPAQYRGMAEEDRASFYLLWQAQHDHQTQAPIASAGPKLVLANRIN